MSVISTSAVKRVTRHWSYFGDSVHVKTSFATTLLYGESVAFPEAIIHMGIAIQSVYIRSEGKMCNTYLYVEHIPRSMSTAESITTAKQMQTF